MAKPNIHPQWFPNAKVYCDGQLIMKVGSTKPRLNVDIWSGNHPFYTGYQKILDTEGRVERFFVNMGSIIKNNCYYLYAYNTTISSI